MPTSNAGLLGQGPENSFALWIGTERDGLVAPSISGHLVLVAQSFDLVRRLGSLRGTWLRDLCCRPFSSTSILII
ncbi:MAG: hypothetical protein WKF56_01935 [Candidatus Limnocylindrales bacterium]